MFLRGVISFHPLVLFIVAAFLILDPASGLGVSHASPDQVTQRTSAFKSYDFDHDNGFDRPEFSSFFMTLFADDEKRFVAPRTVNKIFDFLDIDGDGKLNDQEFDKAFKRWYVPITSTRSCLFLCVPRDVANTTELEAKATELIEKSKKVFKVHYVYVSACHGEARMEPTSEFVKHIQKQLPKVYDIKVYDVVRHLNSLKDKGKLVSDSSLTCLF